MADVRCPMCGKSNPADQDLCKFCGARLRPVWETGSSEETNADLPDWLTGLGGAPQGVSQADADVPDWLSGLRDESPTEDAAEPPEARKAPSQGADADTSGWLKNIYSESSFAGEDETAARPMDDLPEDSGDWLSRIGASGGGPPARHEAEPAWEHPGASTGAEGAAWPSESDADLPDWLRSASTAPTDESGAPLDSEAADWNARLGQDTPDWLKDMAAELPAEESAPEEMPPAAAADELPDWLRFEAEADETTPAQSAPPGLETADWLKDMAADSGIPAEPAEAADWIPPAGGEELPDWLSSVSEETPPASEPQAEAQDLGVPDWLTGMAADSGEPAEPGVAADWMTPAGGDQLPDWLRSADEEPSPVTEPQPAAQDFAAPDWLKGMAADSEEPAEAAELADWMTPAAGSDLPDWLKPGADEGLPAEAETEAEGSGAPDWLSQTLGEPAPAGEENGMLSWLSSLENEPQDLPSAQPAESAAGDLSWLDELESTYSGLSIESNLTPGGAEAFTVGASAEDETDLEHGSLPAWLMGTGMEDAPAAEAAEGAEDDSLNVEALPSWLQAMRPVGEPTLEPEMHPEAGSQPVEGAGPLAGLRGVLPAEPDISQVEKPPVYSVRLQVTEAQEVQAKMLADLLEAEVQPRALPAPPVLTSLTLLRVGVFVALALALLASILTGQPAFLPPGLPVEAAAVRSLVSGLPPGARVLVAVDYDPGFSAEMDALTQAVLAHVLSQGATPVMVSTIPTGPMQAERLIDRVSPDAVQYVNLGFVPGGAMGLASFIQAPPLVLPRDLNGQSAWNAPALTGVDSLDDFSLILVATESPDRARTWIEQIQAQGATLFSLPPLAMLVSAQAEPLVQPYYKASPAQVQGVVSGLSGALAYQAAIAQTGAAARYWSPFNVGLAAAAALMLLGGLFNLIARRFPAKRDPQEATKA